jgi:hypothetical protein
MRVIFFMLVIASCAPAQLKVSGSPKFADLQFLVGRWQGKGNGQPGQGGSGDTSFRLEVQGNVMVRRNHADFPASRNRPAISYDDLMVIYASSGAAPMRAMLWDSQSHMVRYDVQVVKPGTVEFTSDLEPQGRFRMTYTQDGPDRLNLQFDTAPHSQPDEFTNYVQAVLVRTPGQSE